MTFLKTSQPQVKFKDIRRTNEWTLGLRFLREFGFQLSRFLCVCSGGFRALPARPATLPFAFVFRGGDQSSYLNRSSGRRRCRSAREKVFIMAGIAAQANGRVLSKTFAFRILRRGSKDLLSNLHETATPSLDSTDVDVRARGESLLCKFCVPSYVCALAKRIILYFIGNLSDLVTHGETTNCITFALLSDCETQSGSARFFLLLPNMLTHSVLSLCRSLPPVHIFYIYTLL